VTTKGRNPFAQWQESNVKARAEFIELALSDLNSSKFTTVSSLAEYIAKLISKKERNELLLAKDRLNDRANSASSSITVSKSTVLRNNVYRALLDAFMSEKRRTLGDKTTTANVPDIKISKLQMELAGIKADKARLEKYIQTLEKARSRVGSVGKIDMKEELQEVQAKYEHVAYAIIQLYSSKPLQMLLGLEEGSIVDYSDGGRVIVASEHLETIRERLEEIESRKNQKRFK
jgi:hypothetical protein